MKIEKKLPLVTLSLVGINVAVHLVTEYVLSTTGFDIRNALALRYFGGDAFNIVQFVTSMFSHADMGHLVGNMVFLLAFGTAIEPVLGAKRYALLYLLGGIFAGIVPMLFYHYGIQPTLLLFKFFLNDPSYENFMALGTGLPYAMVDLVYMFIAQLYDYLLNGVSFLGASGAISVVMGLSLYKIGNTPLFANSLVKLWHIVALMFLADAYSVISSVLESGLLGGVSGTMAHFAGYLVGLGFVLVKFLKTIRIVKLNK